MKTAAWLCMVWMLFGTRIGLAQEYSIRDPERQEPSPVYLTQPVEGRVEVLNLPEEQAVRISGGTLDEAIEVKGEVRISADQTLSVEIINPPEPLENIRIEGPVRLDDDRPLRVWVENQLSPAEPEVKEPDRFAGYVFRGSFAKEQRVVRRSFTPPEGKVFELTDVVLHTRPEAILWVRVLAPAAAVDGVLAGDEIADIPLLVLDPRAGSAVRPATPVPLKGSFVVEVERPIVEQGAPFQVFVSGKQREGVGVTVR